MCGLLVIEKLEISTHEIRTASMRLETLTVEKEMSVETRGKSCAIHFANMEPLNIVDKAIECKLHIPPFNYLLSAYSLDFLINFFAFMP